MLAAIVLFLPGAYREGLASGIRATVLRPVLAMQRGAVERGARFDDPDRLRAERDSLAAFLVGQAAVVTENRELRTLLGLRQRLPPSFVPAEIVRIPGRDAEGYFQLTAGSQEGVLAGSPIIAPSGLVGRVVRVDARIAFGIDWMNPEFRASAMTQDGTVYGMAEPRRGPGGAPMLALTNTPRHVRLKAGTVILTSGHGGIFPRGVPIGTILGAEGAETSWQRNYLVQPAVSPGEMSYVLVLGAPQTTLGGQDLALAWGVRTQAAPAVDTTLVGAAAVAPTAPSGARAQRPAQEVRVPEIQVGPSRPAAPPLLGEPLQPGDTTP